MLLTKRCRILALYIASICVITIILARLAQADEYDIIGTKSSSKSKQALSLEAALSEAIENNALLRAASYEKTAKEARIIPSSELQDPALEASLTNYPITSLSNRESGMTGNEVMLTQKFPFPGKRDRLKEIAINEFESSNNEVEKTKLNLIRAVKDNYFDLFLSYKNQEILHNQLKLLQALESLATNKYSLGTAPQTDVLELKVRNGSILIQLEEEARKISAKRAELNHLLGREAHLSEWKPLPITQSNVNLSTILERLEQEEDTKNSPQINSLRSLLKAADSKVAYTELNEYPDFEVGVGYMQRFSNRDDNGDDFISAKVSIDLPFFQRTKHREEQREARAEKEKMDALLREGPIELSHELHETVAELTEATNKIALYKKALLPLTDASIASARKAYEANEASYLTVLNLINSRFQSESDYYSAVVQHERALAMLEALTGVSLSDLNVKRK